MDMDTSNKTITVTLTERQARFYVWQSAMRENPAFDDIHEAAADIQNKLNQLEAEAQKAAQANLLNKSMITPDDVEVKFLGFKEPDKAVVWINGPFPSIVKGASYSILIKGYKPLELECGVDFICRSLSRTYNPFSTHEPLPLEYMAHLALLNTNWYQAKIDTVFDEMYIKGTDIFVPMAIEDYRKTTTNPDYAEKVIEHINNLVKMHKEGGFN